MTRDTVKAQGDKKVVVIHQAVAGELVQAGEGSAILSAGSEALIDPKQLTFIGNPGTFSEPFEQIHREFATISRFVKLAWQHLKNALLALRKVTVSA